MTREFTRFAQRDPIAQELMCNLLSAKTDVDAYRETMRSLGNLLARYVLPEIQSARAKNICVVCTVEDADFLARGVIQTLDTAGTGHHIYLMCMWNERIKSGTVSTSPVIKSYEEKFDKSDSIFIIVKSIISGACVVKTNITRALSKSRPDKVFVVSPVMLEGAENRLSREFPSDIARKFKFVHFATDNEKHGDEVLPGIGGSVYELLGLGNSKSKNSYVPQIVKERRKSGTHSFAT